MYRKIILFNFVYFFATHLSLQCKSSTPVSFVLIEASSGIVLTNLNSDKRVPPASLVKLMTSYLSKYEIETGFMNTTHQIFISRKASKMPGSKMFLEEGKYVSVENLIKGLIVHSGNDAAIALAEHIAGNEESFVNMMNKKAKELNLSNTFYGNSTGLPSDVHYTTPLDSAKLASHIIYDYPQFYPLYSIKKFTFNNITQANRNLLLGGNLNLDGLKTGRTKEAGYCLVASSLRDGFRLISVVMGCRSEKERIRETQRLLNFGHNNYYAALLYEAEIAIKQVAVWGGNAKKVKIGLERELVYPASYSKKNILKVRFNLSRQVIAPLKKGSKVGTLEVYDNNKLLIERNVVSLNEVKQGWFIGRLWGAIMRSFSNVFTGGKDKVTEIYCEV